VCNLKLIRLYITNWFLHFGIHENVFTITQNALILQLLEQGGFATPRSPSYGSLPPEPCLGYSPQTLFAPQHDLLDWRLLWRELRRYCRQDEADSLYDLATVEWTLVQQVGTFHTRADVTAVQKQHRRLRHTHAHTHTHCTSGKAKKVKVAHTRLPSVGFRS